MSPKEGHCIRRAVTVVDLSYMEDKVLACVSIHKWADAGKTAERGRTNTGYELTTEFTTRGGTLSVSIAEWDTCILRPLEKGDKVCR